MQLWYKIFSNNRKDENNRLLLICNIIYLFSEYYQYVIYLSIY